jgi:hypothetical protein
MASWYPGPNVAVSMMNAAKLCPQRLAKTLVGTEIVKDTIRDEAYHYFVGLDQDPYLLCLSRAHFSVPPPVLRKPGAPRAGLKEAQQATTAPGAAMTDPWYCCSPRASRPLLLAAPSRPPPTLPAG